MSSPPPSPPGSPLPPAELPPAGADARTRVLVVQALSVQPLAAVLEESGYELLRAADAIAAIDGLAARPSLVVMDMTLPDLPGDAPLALLRRLAAGPAPVLTLSRPQDPPRIAALLAAGAAECLIHPLRSIKDPGPSRQKPHRAAPVRT
ncbi:response regulator [Roseateles chitinivorans]|nr:response regulator [Roseateles chitinivorans]